MFPKSFFKIGLTAAFLFVTSSAETAPIHKNLNPLQNVISGIQDGSVVLNIQFQEPIGGFKGPIFYPRSVQMDFLNAYVKPSKRYFPVDSSVISQVNIVQYDRKTVRMRLVLVEEGLALKNRFHLTRDSQKLKIRIDQDGVDILDRFLEEIVEPVPVEAPEAEYPIQKTSSVQPVQDLSASDSDTNKGNSSLEDFDYFLEKRVVKTEEIQPKGTDSITPVSISTKTGIQNQSPFLDLKEGSSSSPPDLTDSTLKMFSMLALVLGIMFLVLYFFKRFVFKNGLFGGNDQWVNVLASCMLAPRKNITLVEVAGDVLVLGVSQDHIALLATIQDKAKIEKIKIAISMKSSIPGWPPTAAKNPTAASAYRKPSTAAESFAKYLKGFSEKAPKPSAAEVNSLIHKKLGALRTA